METTAYSAPLLALLLPAHLPIAGESDRSTALLTPANSNRRNSYI